VGTRNPVAGSNSLKNVGFSHIWHSDKFCDPYLFLQPLKIATSNLVHNLSSTSSIPKLLLGLNLAWMWAWECTKNFGIPYLFLQLLKLTTWNLVQNYGPSS